MNSKGGEAYLWAIKELSRKYQNDIDCALKTALSDIGVSITDLRQGDLIMVPNSVGSFTDYFYKKTPLFRLHSIAKLDKFGGWHIEYFNNMKIKTVSVQYIESGTFVGGEEDCYRAGIKRNEDCFVISREELIKIEHAFKAVFEDESGDLEFVKYKIKEIMSK